MQRLIAILAVLVALAAGVYWFGARGSSDPAGEQRGDAAGQVESESSAGSTNATEPSGSEAPTASTTTPRSPSPIASARAEQGTGRRSAQAGLETPFVIDESGQGIDGAQVIFLAWHARFWAHGAGATLSPTEDLLDEADVRVTVDGGYLDAAPDLARANEAWFGPLLWAARPGYRAVAVTADYQQAESLLDQPVVLERAPVGRVTVLAPDASPVAGANVEVRLPAAIVQGGFDIPIVAHARALFFYRTVTDERGTAELPAGPGPIGPLLDEVLVRASVQDQASPWLRLGLGESGTVQLESTFYVAGQVQGWGDAVEEHTIPPAVVVDHRESDGWLQLASCVPRDDGAFGPMAVPHRAGDYRVRLDGESIEPRAALFDQGTVGGLVRLSLEAVFGADLWILLRDLETNEDLRDAHVELSWVGEAGRIVRTADRDHSSDYPYFLGGALPSGVELDVVARAPSYAPARRTGLVLPADGEEAQILLLRPAASLVGRVEGLTMPPAELGLLIRGAGADEPVRVEVQLDAEGAFATDEAPAGGLDCVAILADGSRSSLASIGPGDERSVVLEFGPRVVIGGRVVDSRTGDPLDEARVTPVLNLAGRATATLPEPVVAGPGGRFELALAIPPQGRIDLRATGPGHTPLVQQVDLVTSVVEVELRLMPLADFILRFESSQGHGLAGAEFEATGPTPIARRTLESDEVVLEGVAFGSYFGHLIEAEGDRQRWFWFVVQPSVDSQAIQVDGPGSLEVLLPIQEGQPPWTWLDVVLTVGDAAAFKGLEQTIRVPLGPGQDRIVVDGLPLGSCRVDLWAEEAADSVASGKTAMTTTEPHAVLDLDSGPSPFWVRVVDSGGEPAAGVDVLGRTPRGEQHLFRGTTDADGLVVYDGPIDDQLVLDAVATDGASAFGFAVVALERQSAASRERPLTIELRDDASVSIRLSDPTGPQEGVQVTFVNVSNVRSLGGTTVTDAGGVARLDGVGAGSVSARISDPRWLPINAIVDATVDGDTVDRELKRPCVLRIQVTHGGSAAPEAVAISVRQSAFGDYNLEEYPVFGLQSTPAGFATGPDGTLEITGVPEGEVELVARWGDSRASFSVTVAPGQANAVELQLD
ncbi:hypothetical protein [Engelhardtia mirabilis]|uniref:Alpha-2-macroglobulin MG1 domain protein n=1 Tax=Engelhardtia mirabilis TaxID=2528011 RepID=A0A518BE92_9BACT|nr:Alpha-2-macroglobulin MG1 domain protein [Planctomycetes bacterium Pla133]QDU99633.1 Alpha-2-macroglobulin MG1 domain protein [Planctomycetes bacterium Pla86]